MTTTPTTSVLNGIDVAALQRLVDDVSAAPAKGVAGFRVATEWKGGAKSEARVDSWSLGGQRKERNFTIAADEPPELLGTATAPNPQELLMAAMNACIMATWVAQCAAHGVELESLSIESEGDLDLRGFLGIDPNIKPGYDRVNYTVRIKGSGDRAIYDKIDRIVRRTSPNHWNMANAIDVQSKVVVE